MSEPENIVDSEMTLKGQYGDMVFEIKEVLKNDLESINDRLDKLEDIEEHTSSISSDTSSISRDTRLLR